MWMSPWFRSWQGQYKLEVYDPGILATDLFTCCPPGPLEREYVVVPAGRLLSWND
jgi:hypothetical protein